MIIHIQTLPMKKTVDYTNPELIAAIIAEVSNKKKHDKFSIAYKIGMMCGPFESMYIDHERREIVIAKFSELIRVPKQLARLHNGHCLENVFSQFYSN